MTLPNELISPKFANSVLDLACAIQAIPAPTFYEEPRAEYFLEQFTRLGLSDIQKDEVGNVIARLPGARPKGTERPVILSAHMDTVHPIHTPMTVTRLADRITGPGIGDNALGLAAVLGIARILREIGVSLPGDLWLAINVGEEGLGGLRGMQALVNRFQADPLAYLVVEGIGLGFILNSGLGVERYQITVRTPGGHSWVDYGQPSAIHELCRLVTSLASLPLPKTPCTTLNVGVIQGGTSVNTIAAEASIELDLRSENSGTLARLVNEVHKLASQTQQAQVQVKIKRIGRRAAGKLADDHPLPQLAREILLDLGLQPRMDIASTDANLPLSRGYPSICIGITQGNNAHTLEEFILTEPVRLGLAQLYLLIIRIWDTLA